MARKSVRDAAQKLNDAALAAIELAEATPWKRLTVHAIAAKADLELGDIYDMGGKSALLAEIDRTFDRAMGVGLEPPASDASGPELRERLVDVMMQRFDALEKHRVAVANIHDYLMDNPGENALSAARRLKSARWALTAAGLDGDGLDARALGVAKTFLTAKAVWIDDEAPNDRTMAHIDRDLRRYAEWMRDLDKATSWASDAVKDFMAQFGARKSRSSKSDGPDVEICDPGPDVSGAEPDDTDLGKPPPPL